MLLVELSKCGQAFLVLGNPVPCARFKCTLYSVSLDKWRQDAPKKGCQKGMSNSQSVDKWLSDAICKCGQFCCMKERLNIENGVKTRF